MKFVLFIILLCEVFVFKESYADDERKDITQLSIGVDDRPLVFATLGGGMVAVDHQTGNIKWKLKDEPVVKVPNQSTDPIPQFLPDPRHGALYMYGPRGSDKHVLKKLPFTIPELVANAPCRSTDGILYTGKKIDTWFMLDPKTGLREHVSGFEKGSKILNGEEENTCLIDKSRAIFVARTEYNILMQAANNDQQKWNVTFFDYTSHSMARDTLKDYGLIHFTSASNGRVMSFDRKTGDLMWSRDLDTPVVAAYLLDREGLVTVPFNSIGDNTMDHIMEDARSLRNGQGLKNSNMELFPTLYIGEHNHGLYALSSLVDKDTITISTELAQPLMLEGPQLDKPIADKSTEDNKDNIYFKIKDIDFGQHLNGPYLLLGHYKIPDILASWPPGVQSTNNPTHGLTMQEHTSSGIKLINGEVRQTFEGDLDNETTDKVSDVISVAVQTDDEDFSYTIPLKLDLFYKYGYIWLHQQENKGIKVALIILAGLVVSMFWYLQNQVREFQQMSQGGSRGSNSSNTSNRSNGVTACLEEIGDGEMKIGKITFNTELILGKGCEGTFVYRGTFDKRDVAVKRLLPECFTFADREVALLRESDAHANVVRYFCTEQDKQFRYIALELCAATLQDYVEKKLEFECNIDSVEILRQATSGLSHLHAMDIVHRDIKPHNVLLSLPNSTGEVRAMISDFGLCKKLNIGRASFSRRSGVTGTDGWIAPEMINGERTTTSVDIFSLGCVYYYVLSQGKHPFGDVLRRQANILTGEFNLDHLDSILSDVELLVIKILIRAMISPNPYKRPTSKALLKNPIFWSKRVMLNFLQDVSDAVEAGWVTSQPLEELANAIVRCDWRAHVCTHVAADLRTRRTYRGNSVGDLLRALRNKKNHYLELQPEVQESLGKIPDGFLTYWLTRFPLLFAHVWLRMQPYRDQDIISQYYAEHYTYEWHDIPEFDVEFTQDLDESLFDPDKNQLFVKSRKHIDENDDNAKKKKWYNPSRRYRKNNNSNQPNDYALRRDFVEGPFQRKKASNVTPNWNLNLT